MNKLEELLLKEFSDIYCYNCKFQSINEEEAKRIAKRILEIINNE